MNEIYFPSQYKKALIAGSKNITIRVLNERGKYTVGKTYSAKSYAGREWGVRVKILKRIPTTLEKLFELGVPLQSIQSIQKKQKASLNENVELLKFKVISK